MLKKEFVRTTFCLTSSEIKKCLYLFQTTTLKGRVKSWHHREEGDVSNFRLSPGRHSRQSMVFIWKVQLILNLSNKKTKQNKNRARSSNPDFLTNTQLTNRCMKWVWMSDHWFQKVTVIIVHNLPNSTSEKCLKLFHRLTSSSDAASLPLVFIWSRNTSTDRF